MATLVARTPLMISKKARPKFSLGLPPRTLEDVRVSCITPVGHTEPQFPLSVTASAAASALPSPVCLAAHPTPEAVVAAAAAEQKAFQQHLQEQELELEKQAGAFHANEVAQGLYVGSAVDASNLAALRARDIRFVLNLAAECDPDPEVAAHVEYLHIPLADVAESGPAMRARFPDIHEFIRRGIGSNGKVLVHCFLGISRSATAALAYTTAEMIREGSPSCHSTASEVLYECLGAMQGLRPHVLPNAGFMDALTSWCQDCISERNSGRMTMERAASVEDLFYERLKSFSDGHVGMSRASTDAPMTVEFTMQSSTSY